MFRRSLVLVCSAVALIVVSIVGTGAANARPYEAPRISQYSQDIWSVGANNGCRGAIHVGIQVDQQQPGKAFITLTPRAFVGDGPGWQRNPVCKIRSKVVVDFFRSTPQWERTVTAGPRGGRQIRLTVTPGSGLHQIVVGGTGTSVGSANYLIVP
ncbi:hypothetical protein [Gordonia insulae]|uniref:Lipoprotein LppE n=1 Tax=Gordonia insulae TaxID=2420509 RepID=A0A3G8JRE1_9ACTN|nr:hypothetical protein [Gordonia insulae]AZG47042.1 hypothetical protein D7316_03649 [Gordonia insulae]